MSRFFQDLRYALRTFIRSPGFATVAVITLALGIGANTAIFSVVDSALLRPIPYPDSDRLVWADHIRNGSKGGGAISYPDYIDFRDQTKSIAQLVAWRGGELVLTGHGSARRMDGIVASANFFDGLGVKPVLGRGFLPGEDIPGKNLVVVLSNESWKKHFNGDPNIIGQTVTLNQLPTTVIGIMPAGYRFVMQSPVDFYMPLPQAFEAGFVTARGAHFLQLFGRLAPGATVAGASAEIDGVAQRLGKEYPKTNANRSASVTALHDKLVTNIRPALLFLLAAVALVLLIACANVANLLLARATVRQRELAIRFALGATRGRVIRQMLTESVLLSVLGGILGVGLALWGLDILRGILPDDLTMVGQIAIDSRVLLFTVGISIATGVVFGLLPAFHAAAGSPNDALKEGGRGTVGARQRARSVLVAVEIAFAMLLLVGAGLTLKSFGKLMGMDPGFNPKDVMVGSVTLPEARYDSKDKLITFYRQLKEKVAVIPGVSSAAIGYPLPYSNGNMSYRFFEEGTPPPEPGHETVTSYGVVNADFAKALQLPVIRGRFLEETDENPALPAKAVVNQAFVSKFYPQGDVIGKHLVVRDLKVEVVGVIGDARVFELMLEPSPQMYVAFGHDPQQFIVIGARTQAPAGFAASLQRAIESIDADQPIEDIKPMSELVAQSVSAQRLQTLLVGIFGAVALLLAIVGVYGVMSYTVSQRVREIGVRMALGARPGDVTRMVVGQGLWLAVVGIGVGLIGAFVCAILASSLFYGISPKAPDIYIVTAVLLFAVSLLATFVPARRAARVDPMIALRAE